MLPISISPGGVPVASYLPGKLFKITSESGSVSFQITASTLELRLHEILSTLEGGVSFLYCSDSPVPKPGRFSESDAMGACLSSAGPEG